MFSFTLVLIIFFCEQQSLNSAKKKEAPRTAPDKSAIKAVLEKKKETQQVKEDNYRKDREVSHIYIYTRYITNNFVILLLSFTQKIPLEF